mmetsp:Transcript_17779/g.21775  ORF Transcript_17779/g.21775 Transcript_17779/m.21775 type:complete len:521 (+) Transcript_17779:282-1844(+)
MFVFPLHYVLIRYEDQRFHLQKIVNIPSAEEVGKGRGCPGGIVGKIFHVDYIGSEGIAFGQNSVFTLGILHDGVFVTEKIHILRSLHSQGLNAAVGMEGFVIGPGDIDAEFHTEFSRVDWMVTTFGMCIGLLQGLDFAINVPFVFEELFSHVEFIPILLIKQLQRILQRLIHIEIFVIRESSHERHFPIIFQLDRQILVGLVECFIPLVGDGIIRLSLIARRFLDHNTVRRRSMKVMLVFYCTGVGNLRAGVVHHGGRQDEPAHIVMSLFAEGDAAVLQLFVPLGFEIPIDGSGVHDAPARLFQMFLVIMKIGVDHDIDQVVLQQPLEPRGVPLSGQRLKFISEVPWIKIRSNGDPCRDARVHLPWRASPLFDGVRFKNRFVQFLSHPTLRHFFPVPASAFGTGDLHRFQPFHHFFLVLDVFTKQTVHREDIHGDGDVRAVHDPVFLMIPLFPGWAAGIVDVVPNGLDFGMEQMAAVLIPQHPRLLVDVIEAVPTNVGAHVHDEHAAAEFTRAFGEYRPR